MSKTSGIKVASPHDSSPLPTLLIRKYLEKNGTSVDGDSIIPYQIFALQAWTNANDNKRTFAVSRYSNEHVVVSLPSVAMESASS
jgi:hypothetical protein